MHLLSIDEELDDLKKFIAYLNKKYPFNDEKRRYTCIKKLDVNRNIIVSKDNRYNFFFFQFNNGE